MLPTRLELVPLAGKVFKTPMFTDYITEAFIASRVIYDLGLRFDQQTFLSGCYSSDTGDGDFQDCCFLRSRQYGQELKQVVWNTRHQQDYILDQHSGLYPA